MNHEGSKQILQQCHGILIKSTYIKSLLQQKRMQKQQQQKHHQQHRKSVVYDTKLQKEKFTLLESKEIGALVMMFTIQNMKMMILLEGNSGKGSKQDIVENDKEDEEVVSINSNDCIARILELGTILQSNLHKGECEVFNNNNSNNLIIMRMNCHLLSIMNLFLISFHQLWKKVYVHPTNMIIS